MNPSFYVFVTSNLYLNKTKERKANKKLIFFFINLIMYFISIEQIILFDLFIIKTIHTLYFSANVLKCINLICFVFFWKIVNEKSTKFFFVF